MRMRSFSALLVASIAAMVCHAHAQSNPQIMVSVRMCEKGKGESPPKVLAEPVIVAMPGRPFSFKAVAPLSPTIGDGDLDLGTRVNGKMVDPGDGSIQLDLKIAVSNRVPQASDAQTELVRTETLEIRTVLRPGKAKRFDYSDSRWCELRLDPPESGADKSRLRAPRGQRCRTQMHASCSP